MFIRIVGGAVGLAFLIVSFSIFLTEGKLPFALLPATLIGIVFLAYAIGGQSLLTKLAPGLSSTTPITEGPAGRRSMVISDKGGQSYTFFNDDGSTYFIEGDELEDLNLDRTLIERFTYPRGLAVFFHGLLARTDFRFIDEHGREWKIRPTSNVWPNLMKLTRSS